MLKPFAIDDLNAGTLHLFFVCAPGLERVLCAELSQLDFDVVSIVLGGVEVRGTFREVVGANMWVRGCTRILVRLAGFPAVHVSQLQKKADKLPWLAWFHQGTEIKVEATAKRSKLYHSGAIKQRIANAAQKALIANEGVERHPDDVVKGTAQTLYVRIERDWCTVSLDTSGEMLHKRGGKAAVGKAPMRETLASLLLDQAGVQPGMSVLDPMCGSGTFVLEAAAKQLGLAPGRQRDFAFMGLPAFSSQMIPDAACSSFGSRRGSGSGSGSGSIPSTGARGAAIAVDGDAMPIHYGFDRDAGAIKSAEANAIRSGVQAVTNFTAQPLSALARPDCAPGLMISNPPYGDRIGNKGKLKALYATFGRLARERMEGWRVALITNEEGLANATGLEWSQKHAPISHGGLKVRLYLSDNRG